jgi:biofilm protein TabA
MIVDHVANYYLYENIGKGIKAALEFIRTTDFSSVPAGKHDIDGERMFYLMNIYDTTSEDQLRYEAHQKYVDVQFIVQGQEFFGWAPLNKMIVTEEYDQEKEVAFFKGTGNKIPAFHQHFYVLFPNDVHMPNIQFDSPIAMKKVVVKVLLDYALEK